MKANKKYTQTVKQAFHLSAAALDTSQVKGDEDIQVLLTSDNNVFLLCTLNKDRIPQFSLDLNFAEGDKICFSIKGDGLVHLTGFLIPDVEDDLLGLDEEEEDNQVIEKQEKSKKQESKKAKVAPENAAEEEDSDDDDDEEDDTFDLEDADAEADSDGNEEVKFT